MGNKPSFPRVSLSKDHIVIVTGANTGLGYETAKWIAMMGATVVVACRSEERALQAIKRMNEEFKQHQDKDTEGLVAYDELSLEFIKLDCASLKSVIEFVDTFKESGRKLKTLVLNAGIGFHRQAYTEDDHELHFQVNYLSQFLLMAHLLPTMLTSGDDCRIVFVSSVLYRLCSFNMETIEGRQYNANTFRRLEYYSRSKLYQVMQMLCMNRRLKNTNITLASVHPGVVNTEARRTCNDVSFVRIAFFLSNLLGFAKEPYEGAITQINCAVNPDLKGVRDVHYSDCKPETLTSTARNKDNQDALWRYTLACLKDYLNDDVIKILEGQN